MKSDETLDGVLLVDKASDMTSHDVVAIARRTFSMTKVGHCGTLDPLATGLLIVVLGKGTKIQDLLMSEDKEYVGSMKLGETTDSQDADGEILETKAVGDYTDEEIAAAFQKYHGDFYQMPPMVSASKQNGVPLYKLARQGKTVERQPRFVHVYAHQINQVALPVIDFRVVCSKGFYVRTYAHDIGAELGCGAHLQALRRTKSGKFNLDRAVTVDQLKHGTLDDLLAKVISLPEVSRMRGA
ncbi:MAG: tRNA pseudouridine(55) synthase TruB [Gloeobacteraceae cyanobacterium ES-bin-144]|nr:tRNA pseudouridine(55) synthase TruB [Verrucomicrobiales bacterium]